MATPMRFQASPACAPNRYRRFHRRPKDDNALPFMLRTGGDGPSDTHLICGFFSCDVRPFNPLLDSLPRLMRVGPDVSHGSNGLLDQFIRFATAEMGNKRAGSQSILNRLSELMFVEVVRVHMGQLATNNTGWLAGLRDPSGRPCAGTVARPAGSRVDFGGTRLGSRRIPLGVGGSVYPSGRLPANSVFDAMADADGRQATDRSWRLNCIRRFRGRLRIGSRIQPSVQEAGWPLSPANGEKARSEFLT